LNSQEQFWQGQFGDDYTARNVNLVENNYQMFRTIFNWVWGKDEYLFYDDIKSIIEFGAGSGQNIQALQRIFPDAKFDVVEINKKACEKLKELNSWCGIIENSILNFDINFYKYDLVLSKGLLIHIAPENIEKAFDVLYNASNKYILLAEYYSPARREILYRGEHNKLWAFDFIKPILDRGCKILDYGFVSRYDKYPQDDLTFALFKK
jgi:pseudaminic acid biosynthesis-associated methylase